MTAGEDIKLLSVDRITQEFETLAKALRWKLIDDEIAQLAGLLSAMPAVFELAPPLPYKEDVDKVQKLLRMTFTPAEFDGWWMELREIEHRFHDIDMKIALSNKSIPDHVVRGMARTINCEPHNASPQVCSYAAAANRFFVLNDMIKLGFPLDYADALEEAVNSGSWPCVQLLRMYRPFVKSVDK